LLLSIPAAGLAALAAWGAWFEASGGRQSWLAAAVTARGFLLAGALLVLGAAALAAAGRVLWRAGEAGRQRRRTGEEGGAILEFAMVMPIAMFLALVMAQSALLMVGNLLVHYAAYAAARSAVVQIPDSKQGVEPHNYVDPNPWGSLKMDSIRGAAEYAVLPMGCGHADYPEGDADQLNAGIARMYDAYGLRPPNWVGGYLARKLNYVRQHTVVTLDAPANGDTYGEQEDIRVRVRHTLYLSVPLARAVFEQLGSEDIVQLDFGAGERGMNVYAECTLRNEGLQDFVDIEHFPPR